jgi:hypothetical protein
MPLLLAILLTLAGAPIAQAQAPSPNDWLLNAPDDRARFRLLQDQARGFSGAMAEVGQRYLALHQALADANHPLAAYHWEKIREAILAGTTRRPGRAASTQQEFLGLYTPVLEALRSGDAVRAGAAFQQARAACMSCHVAERVAFVNDQPMFRTTAAR